MSAVCFLVAGVLRATLPVDTFTVAWQHSVEKTRWEEDWRVAGRRLVAVESRIEGSGAGMDPPPDARLVDGAWHWHPALPPLPALRLTLSPYTADYRICTAGACRPLAALVHAGPGDIGVVEVAPCARNASPRP